jgi:hypothetical protein
MKTDKCPFSFLFFFNHGGLALTIKMLEMRIQRWWWLSRILPFM